MKLITAHSDDTIVARYSRFMRTYCCLKDAIPTFVSLASSATHPEHCGEIIVYKRMHSRIQHSYTRK